MNERQFELAQQLEQAQRDDVIALARAQCRGSGTSECVDCGVPIPAERRACVPYATRCTECQGRFEVRRTGNPR